jgi:hypothetical protein
MASTSQLEDHCFVGPILRQSRKALSLHFVEGPLAANCEVNPTVAGGALASESHVVPPGTDEWIMDGASKRFESKIDGAQLLATTGVRASGVLIDHMWRHSALGPPFAVDRVHLIQLRRVDFRNHTSHRHLRCPLNCSTAPPSNKKAETYAPSVRSIAAAIRRHSCIMFSN